MPIELKLDASQRRLTATCRGVVTMTDVVALLDAVYVGGALPYGKVVDMNDATSALTHDDMQVIGARVQAYLRHTSEPMGPLAIVAKSEQQFRRAQLFGALLEGRRPIQIFSTISEATEWLDGQGKAPVGHSGPARSLRETRG